MLNYIGYDMDVCMMIHFGINRRYYYRLSWRYCSLLIYGNAVFIHISITLPAKL